MKVKADIIVIFLVVLTTPRISANHSQWWRCSNECKRCVRRSTALENWIATFYSGIFSRSAPEGYIYPEEINSGSIPIPNIPGNGNGTYTRPFGNPGDPITTARTPGSTVTMNSCCETDISHVVLNITEFGGRNYSVVHLKEKYQYTPQGRCREGATCGQGTCVQRYRPHWILVYNNTMPLSTAPVNFIPKGIPSHCECVNIGTRP